jgi:UPF0755 protein
MWKFIKKPRRKPSRLVLIIVAIVLIFGAGYAVHNWYNRNLGPVSSSSQTIYFTVASGSTVHDIAVKLKSSGLIRSSRAFETYVRGKSLFGSLQAGTYALSPSMSTAQIVDKMVNGQVARNLLTILPGKTSTPAQTIIRESLEEMQSHLTPDIISGFAAQGLSVYKGVTLASIVYQESGQPAADPTIAQVFLLRIKQGMPLQSNVTADYASDLAGVARTVTINSPYNTYLQPGLPPGPISNMIDSSLKAVAHPANTDYLYFIAGDDGTIHFSHTAAEHQQAIDQYCHKLCQ